MKEKTSKFWRRGRSTACSRQIVISNLRLRDIRNNLRKLFYLFAESEYFRLSTLCSLYISKSALTDSQISRFKEIKEKRYQLYHSLTHSICSCAVCSSMTKNMAYIPSGKCWVCISCLKNIEKKK